MSTPQDTHLARVCCYCNYVKAHIVKRAFIFGKVKYRLGVNQTHASLNILSTYFLTYSTDYSRKIAIVNFYETCKRHA